MLYNVDENRIWLTGHSMGGFGSWAWGPKRADVWAAFAPCAGGGGPQTGGLPVYVYHGTDEVAQARLLTLAPEMFFILEADAKTNKMPRLDVKALDKVDIFDHT